ncbi:MAG: hypothetical protein ACPLQO_13605 [Desulfotomaculales bacterium]
MGYLMCLSVKVELYRKTFTPPGITDKPNTINLLPEITSLFSQIILHKGAVTASSDPGVFNGCVDLMRDVEFYHKTMEAAYKGFISRFCNEYDVYKAMLPALIKVRISLKTLDIELSKITKLPSLNIAWDCQPISNAFVIG